MGGEETWTKGWKEQNDCVGWLWQGSGTNPALVHLAYCPWRTGTALGTGSPAHCWPQALIFLLHRRPHDHVSSLINYLHQIWGSRDIRDGKDAPAHPLGKRAGSFSVSHEQSSDALSLLGKVFCCSMPSSGWISSWSRCINCIYFDL